VLGVIYNPVLDYLYTGIKGHGSYLSKNKQPPQKLPLSAPRPLPSLSRALIAVEWGSDRSQTAAGSKAESFLRLTGDPNHTSPVNGGKMAHSLRSLGSAALNFSMVAQGGMDMYWYVIAFSRSHRFTKGHSAQGDRLLVRNLRSGDLDIDHGD